MVLWGGLRPIVSQAVIDGLTLTGCSLSLLAKTSRTSLTLLCLSTALILTFAGTTNRWTITLPMLPLVLLQAVRHTLTAKGIENIWIHRSIATLSSIFILMGAALALLFPAVELPPPSGPFHVGMMDVYLPVELSTTGSASCTHVPVRILYPTLQDPSRSGGVPYVPPHAAEEICHQMMRLGAPPPLQDLGFMLHTWRLTKLRATHQAPLLNQTQPFPVTIYSHGLGGASYIYSHQTMALASHGHVVVALTHQDGSAPYVESVDGTQMTFDTDIVQLYKDGKHEEYARERRNRTELRAAELIAATEALLGMHHEDAIALPLSFRGRLDPSNVMFMGHSFGGATALVAAKRRPDLVKSVVAHDTAIDWMPDDSRRALLSKNRLHGLNTNYTGGTGGFGDFADSEDEGGIHDKHLLFIASHEWHSKGWSKSLEAMHQADRLGSPDKLKDFRVVDGAHHNEFSDTSMMTPTWLARAVGVTGQRSPLDTSKDIEHMTKQFLDRVVQTASK